MSTKTVRIASAAAMQKFAAATARRIAREQPGAHARVVALVGDLGAGKTTFVQGFLKELGVRRRIISPTFLIIRPYKLQAISYKLAFHIDCYRLNNARELLSLGFMEILKNPQHVVLIEWPEIMKKYLPRSTRWVRIEHPRTGSHRIVSLS